jgi:hypothetical protein
MDLIGKRLALVTWGKDSKGEDEVFVHAGAVRTTDSGFVLDRGEGLPLVKLQPHWLDRVKPVQEQVRATLHEADFVISLTVGPVPEGADVSDLEFTGLREPPS